VAARAARFGQHLVGAVLRQQVEEPGGAPMSCDRITITDCP